MLNKLKQLNPNGLTNKVEEIENDFETVKKDFIQIKDEFEKVQTETAEFVEENIKVNDGLLKKFGSLENNFDDLNKDFKNFLKNLNNRFDNVADKMEAIKKEYTTLDARLSNLENFSYYNLNDSIKNLENQIAEVPVMVIGETSIAESVLSYHLRTSPQTNSRNYRYYYNSNYLFTAPLNLKHLLIIEFNRLMNSNLSFENVVEELKTYKDTLQNQLEAEGIQTNLDENGAGHGALFG